MSVVERMAEIAHETWMAECRKLGISSRRAAWGEEFMVPYSELSEEGKDFDRVIMRAVVPQMQEEMLSMDAMRKRLERSNEDLGLANHKLLHSFQRIKSLVRHWMDDDDADAAATTLIGISEVVDEALRGTEEE